jgi:hypothetical protein
MYLCKMNHWRRIILLAFISFTWTQCSEGNEGAQGKFDYFQFQKVDLREYDIAASIMIPDATAGIGASFKPNVEHDEGGYKWAISVGRNFQLFLEDYGDNLYRFEDFKKFGGQAGRGPADMAAVMGHPYHSTAQSGPMSKYLTGGALDMASAKVPSYIAASGVPETGFQTQWPVGDAHLRPQILHQS